VIEQPFIAVSTEIEGQTGSEVVLEEGGSSTVEVTVENTLDETVYDMAIEVTPRGNVVNDDAIASSNGFYDSNRGTVRWEVANNRSFAVVRPGETRTVSFTVYPNQILSAASYELEVDVYAKRVAEQNATEQLVGTARAGAIFSSEVFLGSQAGHGNRFTGRGPIPPQVGEETTYTLILVAEAGVNDISDVMTTATLPVYVDWLDEIEGDGELTYNPVAKALEWDAGNMVAGQRKEIAFQVSVTPSTSQVGRELVLLNAQTLRAVDRFTNERLQDSAGEVYTELSTEAGFEENNGTVVR
jgi:hypothetical protein